MIRVLFGTAGWPSGVLEVGSWASARGVARVVIRQIHPAQVFVLEKEELGSLHVGPLPSWLLDRFQEAEYALPPGVRVGPMSGGWQIEGSDKNVYFYILPVGQKAEVFDAQRVAWPLCREAIREYEIRLGQRGRFLGSESSRLAGQNISAELWEALGAVGGGFLERLIRFRPHVIGFRLEGGDQDQVAGFIRACRLFSNAEIVLGGPTATSHPGEVLDELGADYVFAGEAEETFVQFLCLARQWNSRDTVAEIPGLAYSYGGRTFHNTLPQDGYGRTGTDRSRLSEGIFPRTSVAMPFDRPRRPTAEGGQLPVGMKTPLEEEENGFPDLHAGCSSVAQQAWELRRRIRPIVSSALLEANRLDWSLLEGFERPMKSLFFTGSRGCPGACTFCAKLHGGQVRWKSARRLLEEIQEADACVRAGKLAVERWPLFAYTDRPELQTLQVAWAAVYDEDFFLLRDRAIEFFELWSASGLWERYRLSFQTNPRSLLDGRGEVDAELLAWIDRLKPMIQLGGESFHPELLARWRKRHTVAELERVVDALETTRQDYTVFILLSDFDTTPEEVVDGVWLLVRSALPRRGMRIASSPFTIPLYDSQTRRDLEYRGRLLAGSLRSYRDYERPQPGWMDPWAAQLADLADAELHFALQPAYRDAALLRAMEILVEAIRSWEAESLDMSMSNTPGGPGLAENRAGLEANGQGKGSVGKRGPLHPTHSKGRWQLLLQQAEWALHQVRELAFQLPFSSRSSDRSRTVGSQIPRSPNHPGR